MQFNRLSLVLLILYLGFFACKKDDDGGGPPIVPVRDRAEQQLEDKEALLEYLETHYYNSGDFGDSNLDPKSSQLVIEKLASGDTIAPIGKTLLIRDVVKINDSTSFKGIPYEIYYLNLNKNTNKDEISPTFADDVRVTYQGTMLNGTVFDSRIAPQDFSLGTLIPGWRKVLPNFKISDTIYERKIVTAQGGLVHDGTFVYENHGVGAMFLPSGLAYYNNPPLGSGIPSYAPLVFKFDLLFATFELDHDEDGIPSNLEDINGDCDPNNDDTDGDGIPNYLDKDDALSTASN